MSALDQTCDLSVSVQAIANQTVASLALISNKLVSCFPHLCFDVEFGHEQLLMKYLSSAPWFSVLQWWYLCKIIVHSDHSDILQYRT